MIIDEPHLRRLIDAADTRVELWSEILRAADVKIMAEFGVWRGNFAKKILTACDFIESYTMVDPWASLADWKRAKSVQTENFEEIFQEAMENTEFAARKRIVLRGTTKDMIDQIPDHSLDFAYVDGDHTLRGITIDLIRVLPKVKPGGLIGGDDFMPKPWPSSPKFEPTMVSPFAIYYAEAQNLPIFSLPFNQFLIRVDPETGFSFTDIVGKYDDIALNRTAADDVPRLGRAARQARRAARQAKRAQSGG
jgi:hypothetical protein